LIEIQQAAEEACGFFVQLGSAKQVATALFDKLKLRPVRFLFITQAHAPQAHKTKFFQSKIVC
jgi:DNA polymerase I-like protein with 3'-5' exonuclease and polymerase domains